MARACISVVCALLLLLSVVAAGCGDDDGGPPATDGGVAEADSGTPDGDGGAGEDGGDPAEDGGATGDTWGGYAMGFFDTYCVECHAGPPSGRDYRTIDDVRRDADTIRCGVTPSAEALSDCGSSPSAGQFPVGTGPVPSDEERRRIVAWIEAGLPE